MKFGMTLLLFMAVFSIIGTVLPQGNAPTFYEKNYPELENLIRIFHLDRVFSSWWFVAMVALLALNLLFCSIRRLPSLLRSMNSWLEPHQITENDMDFYTELSDTQRMEDLFLKCGFRNIHVEENEEGRFYKARKHRMGRLGSWLTHIGLLFIIIFYVVGKWFGFEAVVYGIPGSVHPIPHTEQQVRIDAFDILYRQDYTIYQYITDASLLDTEGRVQKEGRIQVNHPMKGEGYELFQSGTGWAMDVTIMKQGQRIQEKMLYQSEVVSADDEGIALHWIDFFPDYVLSEGQPYTRSPFPQNPKYLFALYADGVQVALNVASPGEIIQYGDYSITARNPQLFTLLKVVSDPGMEMVGLGGILLLMGVFFSFYWVPQELYGLSLQSGVKYLGGVSKKNQILFCKELKEKIDLKKEMIEK